MGENIITLGGLLSTVSSTKSITVNLYNEKGLLIITFILAGYTALEDALEDDKVTKIEILTPTSLNITIDTSED